MFVCDHSCILRHTAADLELNPARLRLDVLLCALCMNTVPIIRWLVQNVPGTLET